MFATLTRTSVAAIAALAAAGAAMVPAAASAQNYVAGYGGATYGQPAYRSGYSGNGYYNDCTQQRQGRTGAGAVIGGGAGAVIGSQLAARGRRTEGSILGGVLGALAGGAIGRSSNDTCAEPYGRPAYGYQQGYDSYGQAPQQGYVERYEGNRYSYSQPTYSSGYYQEDDRYDDRGYQGGGYQGGGYQPAPVYDRGYQNTDQCRLAESRIRLPDGRSDVRYVRTCPDQSGRYRVVD